MNPGSIAVVRHRVTAFRQRHDFGFPVHSLAASLCRAADWRLDMAEGEEDVAIHIRAAQELVALAEGVDALGDAHPMVERHRAYIQADDDDRREGSVWPVQVETLMKLGAKLHFASAEDLLVHLVTAFRRVIIGVPPGVH